ncbi:hypothetical protein BT69DRAFT_1137866 [Atractiella rhizophila]|nr:hypothetical protein BT69DRAFT_1137866 [Atractiella rhizophila]
MSISRPPSASTPYVHRTLLQPQPQPSEDDQHHDDVSVSGDGIHLGANVLKWDQLAEVLVSQSTAGLLPSGHVLGLAVACLHTANAWANGSPPEHASSSALQPTTSHRRLHPIPTRITQPSPPTSLPATPSGPPGPATTTTTTHTAPPTHPPSVPYGVKSEGSASDLHCTLSTDTLVIYWDHRLLRPVNSPSAIVYPSGATAAEEEFERIEFGPRSHWKVVRAGIEVWPWDGIGPGNDWLRGQVCLFSPLPFSFFLNKRSTIVDGLVM